MSEEKPNKKYLSINNEQLTRIVDAILKVSNDRVKVAKSQMFLKIMVIAISIAYVMDLDDFISKEHIAVIEIQGDIKKGNPTGDGNVLSAAFKKATENENVKAILVKASSSGGAPMDAEVFYNTVHNYMNSKPELDEDGNEIPKKDLHFNIEHICASSCYWMASAFPEVTAHKTSLVGSIGVKFTTFGFTDIMDKLGVEYRTIISEGGHKLVLDPFLPTDVEGVSEVKDKVVDPMYEIFVDSVKESRAGTIKDDEYDDMYSGLFWSGQYALNRGLIDKIETSHDITNRLKEHYETDEFKLYTQVNKPSFVDRMLSQLSTKLSEQMLR